MSFGFSSETSSFAINVLLHFKSSNTRCGPINLYQTDAVTLSIQYKAGLASSCWKGIAATTPKLERYITDMDNWMSANRLKLNMDKTELLWAGTRYNVNVE